MGRDVPDGRMFLRNGQLDIDWRKASGSGRVLQPPAQHVAGLRHRARWSLCGQSAVVPQARDHRPPARRRADGPPRGRGRRGRLRQRLRPPRPAHRRRLGHAGPDRARTPASRSRRWRTASPTRSSIPTDAPRRRRPHDLKRSLHRGDARARHVRRARLRPWRPAEPRRVGGVQVPPDHRGRRHRGLRQRPAAARDRRRLGRVRRARRQAAGRAGLVQPVRRRRAGRQAHALPALVPRRRRPPADDDRLQAGQGRRGLRRLEGHHDALHARPARARGRGRRRRGDRDRVRDHHHPGARLRQAADDVPRGRAERRQPGRRAGEVRRDLRAAARRGLPAQGAERDGVRA